MNWVGSKVSTQRLSLRPIQDQDLQHIYRGLSDPKVIKHYGVSFSSMEETKEQMDWYRKLIENKTGIWFALELKESNEFIGAVGLNDIKKEHRRGEIGFWLLPEFWGSGYISDAVPKVLEYGFRTLKLHRIEAWVETENEKSRKALTKLGFQYEGTLRDHEFKNGRFISVDILANIVDNFV
ncbi:GNAT family N-acetyltransferase [Gracilimonas halophila]|uniref:GNAT family N-acetyltransferase n=1 Tax=Gracilimonas halophila TaxID=1834464 RepID=A0ABW5JIF0_9BACT